MINLKKVSGLPVSVTPDYHLKFSEPLKDREPTFVRKFSEMKPVLMDKNTKPEREEVYYVYRNIALPEHADLIAKNQLEYDITILPPGKLGQEFNKTLGHYHANIPGSHTAHPELYEVLHGEGLFLLQKMDPDFKQVITVLVTQAKAGDKIVYPPNYGHIIINIGREPLVTANWLSTSYKPLYEPVAKLAGMAYYVVADKDQPYKFVPNKDYSEIPEVREISHKFMTNFPITGTKPMYTEGMFDPKRLEFLNKPDAYAVELSSITS
ncbi:MAG TPA: glucose-6-phosphate isomerase family protein [Methylomirabilota bacterium]|jgi:glucose-6-phosphate isomerase|nr:glucose-6-phosphate isomerase family protein [Methylomirabilota bacterium]